MYKGGEGYEGSLNPNAPQSTRLFQDFQELLMKSTDENGRITGYSGVESMRVGSILSIVSDLEARVIALESRDK